jgi:hypothetical protein
MISLPITGEINQSVTTPGFTSSSSMMPGFMAEAGHPGVVFFHVIFKLLAILSYLLLSFISSSYVFSFIVMSIFLASDFWVTKNVSGRILAGLRWWSCIKEDGSSEWIFESLPKEKRARLYDRDVSFFWHAIYLFCGFWFVISVLNLLTLNLNSLVLCVVGLTFSFSNWLGYSKCSKDAKNRWTGAIPASFQYLASASK